MDIERVLIFGIIFLSQLEILWTYGRHHKQKQTVDKFDTQVVKGKLEKKMLCD